MQATEIKKEKEQNILNTDFLYRQSVYLKGTASIKMPEIDPSHVKEISFTCSLVVNCIQKSCL